jgi:hypothetical protein
MRRRGKRRERGREIRSGKRIEEKEKRMKNN